MPANPTEAQQEASRRNGAQSRGPRTDAGKARSALNGVKHGLRAATVVLTNESQHLYDRLHAAYVQRLQPANQIELDLVTQMVNAQWRLRRLYSNESALLDVEMAVQQKDLAEVFARIDAATTQALAFKAIAVHDNNVLERMDRTELRLGRQYDRALRSLLLLQRNRTTEPERPTHFENISPQPSVICEEHASAPRNTEPDNEAGETQAEPLPETNTTEEDAYQRYEFQPDPPAPGPQTASRLHDVLHKKPGDAPPGPG